MNSEEIKQTILQLMKREIVPAVGCTEPAAVALCVAAAAELLPTTPSKITVQLSGNMLKNAMGVGIPGTGMIGLPIAIALGALCGNSADGLEVLGAVTPDDVQRAREYISRGVITILLARDTPSNLYIEVQAESSDGHTSRTVISDTHTHFILKQRDNETLMQETPRGDTEADDDVQLTLRMVYDFATQTPLQEIEFIREAAEMNTRAADEALHNPWGHRLGRMITGAGMKYFGDTPLAHILAKTSAACDARMGGCPIAVMSNSGSGNQGITTTMPIVSFALDMEADEEHTLRALALSHLTSIYIKQGLGRLSALCGCVVASTGASAGIAYLMGADYPQICAAVKNMVANLTGMICDGAKPSCAMKIASGVGSALMSAMLAVNGRSPSESEGIICDDIDRTIHNLTSIGKEAMRQTDAYVLEIMTSKS